MDGVTLIALAFSCWITFCMFGGFLIYQAYRSDSPKFTNVTDATVDADDIGKYKCPNAANVANKGTCIFKKEQDAINWCTADYNCTGYLKTGDQYLATTKIKFGDKVYKSQDPIISPLFKIINKYAKNYNNPGEYICPKAHNTWIDPSTKLPDPKWCRFTNVQDAANFCISNKSCMGYLNNNDIIIGDKTFNTYIASSNLKNDNKDQLIGYSKNPL